MHVQTAAFRSPDDPRLDGAVAQAVIHLFPLRDPYIDHDREFILPFP